MDLLIINHFLILPWEIGNDRFVYLANIMKDSKINIEIVSSSFSHFEKKEHIITDEQRSQLHYKITLLNEPEYRKNISLQRLKSHKTFAKNLKCYLKERTKPDVIYCAIPSLDVAAVAADYCKKNGVKLIIDVQDLWPEAFQMALNVPIISNIVFAPMKRRANKIYAAADEIVGVSEEYCKRAMKVNKNVVNTYPIYLGVDINNFDENVARNCVEKSKGIFVIGYCGTLGHSYDLNCALSALKILKEDRNFNNIQLRIFGDGPLRHQFEEFAKQCNVDAVFYGAIKYSKMCGELSACDIAINPIRKGAAQSIINKHGDYAAAGLPIVNTQECLEYRNLLEQYKCGINCNCEDPVSVAKAIELLVADEYLRISMGYASRKLAEDLFNRSNTYKTIVNLINKDLYSE